MTEADQDSIQNWQQKLDAESAAVGDLFRALAERGQLRSAAPALAQAYSALVRTFEGGGTLYLCGNGGSMTDAIHISGELLKSFVKQRPLKSDIEQRLLKEPDGSALAKTLQSGLRSHVLGLNPALLSAASNDLPVEGIGYAQELLALARPGDALLGISTSGKARNVHLAVSVARAMQMVTIGLTGAAPNPLAERVDICIAVPERETYRAQEMHEALYHQLCLMLEARFF